MYNNVNICLNSHGGSSLGTPGLAQGIQRGATGMWWNRGAASGAATPGNPRSPLGSLKGLFYGIVLNISP